VLADLLSELWGYPSRQGGASSGHMQGKRRGGGCAGVVMRLQFASESGVLSFVSTTTVFGTPVHVALSELAIESFFPVDAADAAAADAVRRLAEN
jgi:hypothetical protein